MKENFNKTKTTIVFFYVMSTLLMFLLKLLLSQHSGGETSFAVRTEVGLGSACNVNLFVFRRCAHTGCTYVLRFGILNRIILRKFKI